MQQIGVGEFVCQEKEIDHGWMNGVHLVDTVYSYDGERWHDTEQMAREEFVMDNDPKNHNIIY